MMKQIKDFEKLLAILCEINNRLCDISITLQTSILLNNSDLDKKKEGHNFLADFFDVQKTKYHNPEDLSYPYNPLTGKAR